MKIRRLVVILAVALVGSLSLPASAALFPWFGQHYRYHRHHHRHHYRGGDDAPATPSCDQIREAVRDLNVENLRHVLKALTPAQREVVMRCINDPLK